MSYNLDSMAQKKLEEILHIADRVIFGRVQLVDDYVLGNNFCCWRTYWGMVWVKAHEGLSLDLPEPPPWPPEPLPSPSTVCKDCPFYPHSSNPHICKYVSKGGIPNARSV